MQSRTRTALTIAIVLAAPLALHAAQSIVTNGSMENGSGGMAEDPMVPHHWTMFGQVVERSGEANLVPIDGEFALKMFGGSGTVGAYQDVEVTAGDSISIRADLFTRSFDKLGGDAQAGITLEFFNDSDEMIGSANELFVLDISSDADVWTEGSIGPITAPAGAVTARMVCVWRWTDSSAGSAFWDDCQMTINGGENVILNGDFEEAGFSDQSAFGIDDWTGFGDQEKSEDFAYHGGSSVMFGTNGAYSGIFQNMAELEAGDRLIMRAKVYHDSASPMTGSSAAAIKLEFSPAQGIEPPAPEEHLVFDENANDDEWVLVTLSTVVPDNVTLARCVILADDVSSTNGPVYFDSASVLRGSAPGVNQLTNASFESGAGGANGLDDWTEFRGFACSARKSAFEVPAHDGFSTMKVSGECVAGIYQDVVVVPGETFELSAYVRSNSADPFDGPDARAGVKVEWQSGTVPDQIDINDPTQPNTLTATAPADTWNEISIDYTMPAGSAALTRCTLIYSLGSGDGKVYFDGVEAVVINKFDGADANGDGAEDLLDFAAFQRCFSGDGVTPLKWDCLVFDNDDDDDIDLIDFDYFAPRMTGPQ